ncbi:hypothetical protein [Legionella genomosp. 1]|uniref:hypothetical protein n=1 Tax=Legionella genomosp. 1 TaxID=1093625 RepID=UPI001056E204|nr:hypothetical protein [Legionella genomosp. 1]
MLRRLLPFLLLSFTLAAAPQFKPMQPQLQSVYEINTQALCSTAKETLAYLNKGPGYDPQVIHGGKIVPVSLERVKKTLAFICQHQKQMSDPSFIRANFEFIRWYPDLTQAQKFTSGKPLLKNLPKDSVLMTKYFVHQANVSEKATREHPYALYGLPNDEHQLTIEEANQHPELTRFRYGKQAILKGALKQKKVPVLAYLSRADLEEALMEGTLVASFPNGQQKIFNVHRCNNIAYDRNKKPYAQERFWYFREVEGIKGYGKDADHKITVNTEVTFAGDLQQFGLGKLLLIQYSNAQEQSITRMGILADTGGAFANNLYQIDYLAGSFSSREEFFRKTEKLPNYIAAYFLVLRA